MPSRTPITVFALTFLVGCTGAMEGDTGEPSDTAVGTTALALPEGDRVPVTGDCGAAPTDAPDDCGSQQWTEYSAHLPVGTAWLAIANTGSASCTVTVTKLELSYSRPSGSAVLTSAISGAQKLHVGTSGTFGTYYGSEGLGPTYTIPARASYYVHPFGAATVIPTDATKVTLKFAANIGSGCVVQGGIDTYHKNVSPDPTPSGYTKGTGEDTDFIKEAIKSPWFASTISSASPRTYSITRHAAPSSFTGRWCYNAAKISWASPSDAVADASHKYGLFRGSSTFASTSYDPDIIGATPWVSLTATSYTETGLSIGTPRYYAVYGTGDYVYEPEDDLHSALATTSITPTNIPWSTPTAGTYSGRGTLLLSWASATSRASACSDFVTAYMVKKGTVSSTGVCSFGAAFEDPIDGGAGTEDATQKSGFTGLTSGRRYCFAVAAKLSSGAVSNYSSTVMAYAP